ncbi:hypothetical protein AD998_05605 [bacterium 336/3]|nr:hypothetical protein AD998_05605 [bacterium 336/3]
MEELKNLRDLEFIAQKSKDLLDKQIASHKHKHSNSSIITTILVLFIPLLSGEFNNSHIYIKLLLIIPIISTVWAIILLLGILRSKPLYHGINISKFDDLVNDTYENILLCEIGANKSSFNDNSIIIEKNDINYALAIKLTIISILVSISLLFTNKLINHYQPLKLNTMSEDNKNKENSDKNNDSSKKRIIPIIEQKDRTKLNNDKKMDINWKDTSKNK